MGVWIEISIVLNMLRRTVVTPLVGVWIEIIDDVVYNDTDSMSLPLWECGLKYQVYFRLSYTYGHSPCGSVD